MGATAQTGAWRPDESKPLSSKIAAVPIRTMGYLPRVSSRAPEVSLALWRAFLRQRSVAFRADLRAGYTFVNDSPKRRIVVSAILS
jgi:hypothetical protein